MLKEDALAASPFFEAAGFFKEGIENVVKFPECGTKSLRFIVLCVNIKKKNINLVSCFPFDLDDNESVLVDIFNTCTMMPDMDWVIAAAMRCALNANKPVPLLEIVALYPKMNEDQLQFFGHRMHEGAKKLLQRRLASATLNTQGVDLGPDLPAQLCWVAQFLFSSK